MSTLDEGLLVSTRELTTGQGRKTKNFNISVFDKLIWCTIDIGPKSFLFGTAQFSLWARWCS